MTFHGFRSMASEAAVMFAGKNRASIGEILCGIAPGVFNKFK
jgi:hypothetical protein